MMYMTYTFALIAIALHPLNLAMTVLKRPAPLTDTDMFILDAVSTLTGAPHILKTLKTPSKKFAVKSTCDDPIPTVATLLPVVMVPTALEIVAPPTTAFLVAGLTAPSRCMGTFVLPVGSMYAGRRTPVLKQVNLVVLLKRSRRTVLA